MTMPGVKLTVGASDDATKSKSSGDDLHDDCECIDTVNVMVMVGSTAFYTCKLSLCFSSFYCGARRMA